MPRHPLTRARDHARTQRDMALLALGMVVLCHSLPTLLDWLGVARAIAGGAP